MTESLAVFLDGIRAGTVTQASGGAIRFSYDETYRASPDATPLSLSMPLAAERHSPKVTTAFLWGLLPDSEPTLQRWGREHRVSPRNPFALLRHMGRDAAGAVQILPDGTDATDAANRQGTIEWLTDDDFDELAAGVASHADNWDPGRFAGRWSLAGAQPKVALFRDTEATAWGNPRDSTPTTHIVKPTVGQLRDHHVNEFLCLRAASHAGLPAANVEILETARVRVLVSQRYDRRQTGDRWRRIHQEDLCQSLSVHPALKYQSDGGPGVKEIGDLFRRALGGVDRTESAHRLLRALAFNVLIGGTDAHAKNYSMLLRGGRARLAPLYDVASMAAYQSNRRLRSAMKIGEHWTMYDVTSRDWERAGRQLGVSSGEATETVEALRHSLPLAFAAAVAEVPDEMAKRSEEIAERIVAHVARRWRPLQFDPQRVLD